MPKILYLVTEYRKPHRRNGRRHGESCGTTTRPTWHDREGLPRALVEAAAGRPIVATDVPGCREVARDGKEGILVPIGHSDATARALTALAADQALRQRLGAATNARFNERFTSAAVCQTVRMLYRSMVPSP